MLGYSYDNKKYGREDAVCARDLAAQGSCAPKPQAVPFASLWLQKIPQSREKYFFLEQEIALTIHWG